MFKNNIKEVEENRALNMALEQEDAELDKEEVIIKDPAPQKFGGRASFLKGAVNEEDEISEQSSIISEDLLNTLFNEGFGEESEEENSVWYGKILKQVFRSLLSEFKMARKLYKNVLSTYGLLGGMPFAYIYKLKDKMALENEYAKKFVEIELQIVKICGSCENVGQAIQAVNNIKSEELKLVAIIHELFKLGLSTAISEQFKNKDESLKKWFAAKRSEIVALGDQEFFKVENYAELQKNGAIYTPGVYHSWSVNLSWVLAHLRKGSHFKIISDIGTNKYRRSKGNESEHSAFIREICTCLKAQYEFDAKNMILKPSIHFSADNCISSGKEGSGVNPSKEEVDTMFDWLVERCSSNKLITHMYAESGVKSTNSDLYEAVSDVKLGGFNKLKFNE